MLTGRVTSEREAIVPIEVLGHEGRKVRVEAGIDTGYNGFLTLPKAVIAQLGLAFVGPARAALGDGKEVRMDLFLAAVEWEAERQDVLVLEAEGGALVGMALLKGCRLVIDVEEDGKVSIVPLAEVRSVS